MHRLLASLTLIVGLAAVAAAGGCELIASVDRDKIPIGGGGNGGGTGGTTNQGGGGAAECTTPTDCVLTVGECQDVGCDGGKCVKVSKPKGTALASPPDGDCKARQCDGSGNVETVNDDTDVPVDGKDCTKDVCKNGVPSNPNEASGTACGTQGDLVCDGDGKCVGCVDPTACSADSECQHPTCTGGVCGVDNEMQGTKLATQTSGACKVDQCDGMGGTETVDDDTDKPVDGTVCTDDVCTSGVPTNPPVSGNPSCTEGTGHFCQAGACVECLQASDCGVDDECNTHTCSAAGVCGITFTANNTPVASQTNGDCQKNVCNGAGMVVAIADDSDLPNDNNACTNDTCSGGMKVFTNKNSGASCGGALVCDGMGHCQCNVAADCGTNDECKTFSCTAGSCGTTYTMSGTPVSAQTSGDCKQKVCDGTGNVVSVNVNDPPSDDGNQCTDEVCNAGVPSHPVVPINTPCTQGGSFCSAAGQCVACNAASQCGTDTDCKKFSCTANMCGSNNIMAGTPTSNQVQGDCHENRCDGSGGVTPAIDNTDTPQDDGNPCTDEICTAGVPSHPAAMIDTPCNQGGGSFCDGASSCVECNHNGQCSSMVCTQATHTCAAAACNDMVKNGTESDVDCGGTCSTKCPAGDGCSANSDCAGGSCKSNMTCQVDCTDATSPFNNGTCTDYCTCMLATCTNFGGPQTMAACLNECATLTPAGLCCRGYHCNNAAAGMPSLHCPHAEGMAPCNL